MARYDRIARLDAPTREHAFPGWLVLRDLEGREREPEMARRARLRFLALRPVRRMLDRGFAETDSASLARQVQSVRTALAQLPARDAERLRIAEYLCAVEERGPQRLATATIAMGEAAEAGGHAYAAEEFYHTALELSAQQQLAADRMRALRFLARLHAARAEWARSQAYIDSAVAIAEDEGDLLAWAHAVDGLAALLLLKQDVAGARAILARLRDRGQNEQVPRLIAIADAGTCAVEVAAGRPELAVEAGWRAIEALDPSDEDHTRALMALASAFRRLGLRGAAEACYLIIARSPSSYGKRADARVQHALVAAEAGDHATFRERREALLDPMEEADHGIAAAIHFGLARGAMLIDDLDDARTHLREAIAVARAGGLGEAVVMAEDLLSGLEDRADSELYGGHVTTSEGTRRIADRIESMGRELVASG